MGNLLLLLKLFLGLGHFSASIICRASSYRFLLVATILLGLLSFKHLLPGSFSFFKLLLLFFSLPGLSPFCDVFLQLCVESLLLLCLFVGHCELICYSLMQRLPMMLTEMTLLLMMR